MTTDTWPPSQEELDRVTALAPATSIDLDQVHAELLASRRRRLGRYDVVRPGGVIVTMRPRRHRLHVVKPMAELDREMGYTLSWRVGFFVGRRLVTCADRLRERRNGTRRQ